MNLPLTKEIIERKNRIQIMKDLSAKEFVLHAIDMIYGFHYLNRDKEHAKEGGTFHRSFINVPDDPTEYNVFGILQGGSVYILIAKPDTPHGELTLNRLVYCVSSGDCTVFGGWSATFFPVHLIREEKIAPWYTDAMDVISWIKL